MCGDFNRFVHNSGDLVAKSFNEKLKCNLSHEVAKH